MTLTALHIAHFKAFAASQRIPIRPITLIFGANSAGKSSIIHALALAHHALEAGELDVHRTQVGGESIDLGGFRQYVHRHERDQRVDMVLELDPSQLEGRAAQLLGPARTLSLEVSIGQTLATHHPVRVEAFAIRADGQALLTMSIRGDGRLRLDLLDHGHPVLREIVIGLLALSTTTSELRGEDFEAVAVALDELVPEISARVSGLLPRLDLASSRDAEDSPDLVAVSRGRRSEDLGRAVRAFFPRTLGHLIDGVAEAAEAEIRKLQYLGPLRSYPPRHLAFSQHHDTNWFAGGGYAWDVVRQRSDVRRRINEWLGDEARLKTPYELVVRELIPERTIADEIPAHLAKALHDGFLSLFRRDMADVSILQDEVMRTWQEIHEELSDLSGDDEDELELLVDESIDNEPIPELEALVSEVSDSHALAEYWTHQIAEARSEVLQDLVLIDKRSDTPVSHRDVGIGVSQVLPVLVSAYASRGKLLAIEQPEIHLHPALQAELGDVFLESALGDSKNTLLLETHSEHLILRILRRIRETTDRELPEGATAVRPEQVSVLYVRPGREGSEVLHIPVTSDGDFELPWPEGFFAERAKELF